MNKEYVFNYGIDMLTASQALAISRGELKGILNDRSREEVRKSSRYVETIAQSGKAVYGINTGFGPLCTTMISSEDTRKLQSNILKSHAVGVGKFIDVELSRIMLVLKLHALSKGYSGIQEATLDRMIWHLETDAIPLIPEQGSVGASGDLAPLSHLFLPLIGLGKVYYKGEVIPAGTFLKEQNVEPLSLSAKEGLALINGTQFMAAHGVKAVERLHNLLTNADIISAMMIEGLKGSEKPFDEKLHQLRPYTGNIEVASNIRTLLKNSEIVRSHADCSKVQDPYSLRCIPQVHGASRDAYAHLKKTVEIEINSVTDNPVVFSETSAISGGNFHGQPIALPLDYACLAASEIGNISDRRIYLSLEGNTPGLPKLLMKETGLNSGFMILQYTSAALASENKGLCFPSSADSIPTSLGQEDHVSMGSIGARKLHQVIENVEKILGIELFCAAQAMDYHAPLKSGKVLEAVHRFVRSKVYHIEEDQIMHDMMQVTIDMVKDGSLLKVAQEAVSIEQEHLF
ncbi:histidine ammonia-lyase [Chryseobacterium arthrosphaerae]|uniref:histidine ammonia-lyase n=1 Tax=Chryseobacterium arthrosphaerae TaxID=651561 RepID=UPI0023E0D688|nr:histidine ammonia-lyase [Chryseobacterium arthrosphaerae]WES97615.1 histidine ammonia-lyase [Chryseobacterium arthrosphaerae]